MERKLIALRQQLKGVLDSAEAALNAGNETEFDAQMKESDRLNGEIANVERLLAARGDFNETDSHLVNLHDVQQEQRQNDARRSRIDNLRGEREYVTAWASAIRGCISPARAAHMESLAPLTNLLTVSGGDPEGSEGGFLAPIDFDELLHEYEKDYIDLSAFFARESVTAHTGWRAFATSGTATELPKIEEGGTIGKTTQPSFEKITYKLSKYGDRLAISRELLAAEPGVLMDYVSRWFARRYVATKNALLTALLDKLTATEMSAGSELKTLKTTLNKTLSTAYSRGASILTNQSGFDALDQLVDANNRPLLVPNPADPDTYRFKGKQITFADDDLIVNADGAAPIYIGKFSAYGSLFERQGIELASTDVGGDAWTTASPEIRALVFLDAEMIDQSAVAKLTYSAGS